MPQAIEITLDEGVESEVELRLARGQTLRGKVYEASGTPAAGVAVYVTQSPRLRATTDALGSFELDGVPLRYVLVADAGDRGRARAFSLQDAVSDTLEIRLPRVFALRGSVRGSRGAETQVVVEAAPTTRGVEPPGGRLPHWMVERLPATCTVAEDGRFELRGLGAAGYAVRAVAEGVGASVPRVVGVAADTDLELDVVPDETIRVRVLDRSGQPVAGARVLVSPDGDQYLERLRENGLEGVLPWMRGNAAENVRFDASEEGVAEVPYRRCEALVLLCDADGYGSNGQMFLADEQPAACEVRLDGLATLRGVARVDTRATGSVEVAVVPVGRDEAVRAARAPERRMPPDGAGSFAFDVLSEGTWVLRLRGPTLKGAKPTVRGKRRGKPMDVFLQRVVQVRDSVVNLGELRSDPRVDASFTLECELPERQAFSVWLHKAYGGDPRAVWVGLAPVEGRVVQLRDVAPGDYSVTLVAQDLIAVGGWSPVAKPFTIQVAAESGVVSPASVVVELEAADMGEGRAFPFRVR